MPDHFILTADPGTMTETETAADLDLRAKLAKACDPASPRYVSQDERRRRMEDIRRGLRHVDAVSRALGMRTLMRAEQLAVEV